MQHSGLSQLSRRGITVLALLLLIIAVVIAVFFLIRYLGTGTAAALLPLVIIPNRLGRQCGTRA